MADYNREMVMVPTTSLRMELIEAGNGPLMVFLHGFPEMADSWKNQIKYFSGKGYKVVAPNMRGYGNTERPRSGYDVDTLADDIAGIFDHYGADRAVLAGHDWGGLVAWHFAYRHPDRLKALAILNAPHPIRYEEELRRDRRQRIRSLYVLAFQIPYLPEWYMGLKGARLVSIVIERSTVRKETFTREDLDKYAENMSKPGALRAGLAYYRQAIRDRNKLRTYYKDKKITAPTQVIWAQQDNFLGPALAEGLDRFVDAPLEVVPIDNCGHWVQQEAADEVNEAMYKFLSTHAK